MNDDRIDRLNLTTLKLHSKSIRNTFGMKMDVVAYIDEELLNDYGLVILGYATKKLNIVIGTFSLSNRSFEQLLESSDIRVINLNVQTNNIVIVNNMDGSVLKTSKGTLYNGIKSIQYDEVGYNKIDEVIDLLYNKVEDIADNLSNKVELLKKEDDLTNIIGIAPYNTNKYVKITTDQIKVNITLINDKEYNALVYSNMAFMNIKTYLEKLTSREITLDKYIQDIDYDTALINTLYKYFLKNDITEKQLITLCSNKKLYKINLNIDILDMHRCLDKIQKIESKKTLPGDYILGWIDKSDTLENLSIFACIKTYFFSSNKEMIEQIKKDRNEIILRGVRHINKSKHANIKVTDYNIKIMKVLPDHTIMIIMQLKNQYKMENLQYE